MKKISFIITNFNTKKYTEWCYNSIRQNLNNIHEIVMMDDGSEDGTWELLQKLKSNDDTMIIHRNEQNIGIAYSYNKMVELSSNKIVCMLHSDMYVPLKFDEIMLKHMEKYDFITPLRVEPDVGYPGSVDKLLIDFGTESENFDENGFVKWHDINVKENKGRVEQRMFFPWMTTKTLYNKVGGNDELFCKYMVDDDDFYLRIKMSGAKYCQLFETAVYHMPSKSVRMREDGQIDIDKQYNKSLRNFIRKWGVYPADVWDENRDMYIPKKYDIGFVIDNCDEKTLNFLEPFASNIYIYNRKLMIDYISKEQPNTLYDLTMKIKSKDKEYLNDVIVYFDAMILDQEKISFLQRINPIISNSGEVGKMQFQDFVLEIKSMDSHETDNLKLKRVERERLSF